MSPRTTPLAFVALLMAGCAAPAGLAPAPVPAASTAPAAAPPAPSATPAATLQPMFPDGRLTWDGAPQPKPVTRNPEREDTAIYRVVVNYEEQYSIWRVDRELPLGWNDAGKQGSRAECLAYIEEVWTDMRPLSIRKKQAEAAAAQGR